MADYLIQFSCRLDLGSPARARRALRLHAQMAAELQAADDVEIGLDIALDGERPSAVWMHDGGGYGEPDHVIAFVLRCAEVFQLQGRWSFRWALTCSRPLLDGFGGGAQALDLAARRSLGWTDCETWLAGQLAAAPADGPA